MIFKSYLCFICHRRDALLTEDRGSVLVILLQNILSLAIDIEHRMKVESGIHAEAKLETVVIEEILDIFFTINFAKICFTPQFPDNIYTSQMKSVCQFIYAKTFEKENTLKTIQRLEEIKRSDYFGKHRLSYEAILFYYKALAGDYKSLNDWLTKIDSTMPEQTHSEWFYNRIKVYQCDCDMMDGRFKTAESALILLQNGFMSNEDHYSIQRTLGHVKRFNFQLTAAKKIYQSLMREYYGNTIIREYLLANYCETECYFPPRNFIYKISEKVESLGAPYNRKNMAKMLYSLAIASTVKKHYKSAARYIKQSLEINHGDGYISGELFAYMAQAYLDYAQYGSVKDYTKEEIERRLDSIGVYRFFELPLALMENDRIKTEKIANDYEWLDYNYTLNKYRQFLSCLRE